MRIIIDYEPYPEYEDDAARPLVALETTLYDGDRLVGSLSNSTFYADADDWTTGTFESVLDIPERCVHLRSVATDLIAEYARSLPPMPPPPAFDAQAAAQRALQELVRSVLAYDARRAGRPAHIRDYDELLQRVQQYAEHAGIPWTE